METSRLEAFSDGVIAVIITIMVLELKVPQGTEWSDPKPMVPVLLAYVLSFAYIGIYWNNHHHMLTITRRISGGVLWANLHLLFWLSLVPWLTAWMGQHPDRTQPCALYGFALLMAAIAYAILQKTIIRASPENDVLKNAIGRDFKGLFSPGLYAIAIACSFWLPLAAQLIYVAVAVMWLVPDRRIEKHLIASKD